MRCLQHRIRASLGRGKRVGWLIVVCATACSGAGHPTASSRPSQAGHPCLVVGLAAICFGGNDQGGSSATAPSLGRPRSPRAGTHGAARRLPAPPVATAVRSPAGSESVVTPQTNAVALVAPRPTGPQPAPSASPTPLTGVHAASSAASTAASAVDHQRRKRRVPHGHPRRRRGPPPQGDRERD